MISSKIDSYVYSDVIKNCGLVQNANHMNGQYGWYFQHDGATCHQSKKTIDELSKIMNILPNWPPNSPDLNPIELLWGIIKKILRKKAISTIDEFRSMINEIWENIPLSTINKLVNSFKERVRMCLQIGGDSIQCFIRNNLHSIPDFYQYKIDDLPKLWTEEEDTRLKDCVYEFGTKWKIISNYFPNKTPVEIKNRYNGQTIALSNKKPLERLPPIQNI